MLTRRGFLTACGIGGGAVAVGARQSIRGGDSLLRVRPRKPAETIGPGEHALGLAASRDGVLLVPRGTVPESIAQAAFAWFAK